jgi:signal peptide peptidase SppA
MKVKKKMNLFKKLFGSRKSGMRLSHIIEQVYLKPMLITPDGFSAIDKVIQSKLANEPTQDFKPRSEDGTEFDIFGDPLPVMEIDNKIAYIPIVGPISYKVSGIERVCGICDVGELKRNVKMATEDDMIDGIILDVSTPGGSTLHVAETAAVIAECAKKKPILAFTDSMAASAGYYLIAGATEIYATPSSDVGSIGCYMALLDYSKMYEQAGVKVDLFVGQNAKYKAMGFPGLPLTQDQKDLLQSEVDAITTQFKAFVKQYRPQVAEEAMNGQTIFGKEKVDMGLVDYLVGDIDELIIQ